jgi:hypothetical protein
MNASNIRMELTAQIEQQLNQLNEDELAFVNKYVCMLFRRIRSSASAEAVGQFGPGDKVLSSRGRYGTVVGVKRTRVVVVFDNAPGQRWLCPASTLKKMRVIPEDDQPQNPPSRPEPVGVSADEIRARLFAVGDRVRHARYGMGTVQKVNRKRVVVSWDDVNKPGLWSCPSCLLTKHVPVPYCPTMIVPAPAQDQARTA